MLFSHHFPLCDSVLLLPPSLEILKAGYLQIPFFSFTPFLSREQQQSLPRIISPRTKLRAAVGLLHPGHPCKVTSRIQGFNSFSLSSCPYPSGSKSLQCFTPNLFPAGLHSTVIVVPRLEHWKSAVSTSKREGTRVTSPGLSDTWPQHLLPQKYQMADLALTQGAHNRRF